MARAPMPAPQMIETPAMRRSALLAKMLEEQRQPTEIRGGYGELGARLLAQGITQWGANKADKTVREEGAQRLEGQTEAANLALARLLGREAEPPAPMSAAGAVPPMAPPVTNTQEPVQAQIAPVAPVQGSPLPPAGQPIPMADVPPMPQAAPAAQSAPPVSPQQAPARNSQGITPGEEGMLRRALASGDPGIVAWAQGVLAEIENRQSAPSEWKDVTINGLPYLRDQYGATRPLFEDGVPTEAMNQNATVGGDNPYGVAEGTGISLDPFNRPQIVGRPPEGYTRGPDGLTPEPGGREDLGGNPTARFNALQSVRAEIKPVLDQAVSLNRNIQAVRAGIRAQNGSGDNAIINGLQRLTDDGVVREGDVALQLRMQGIEGGISGLLGYLRSDGTFSPEIRQQLSRLAEDIYSNQSPLFREQVMGRRDLIERTFGDGSFDDIISPSTRQAYGWEAAPSREAPRPRPRTAAPNRPRQPASGGNDPLGLR